MFYRLYDASVEQTHSGSTSGGNGGVDRVCVCDMSAQDKWTDGEGAMEVKEHAIQGGQEDGADDLCTI